MFFINIAPIKFFFNHDISLEKLNLKNEAEYIIVLLKKKEEELDNIIENEKYDNSMLVPNRKNRRYQIPYGIIFVIFMILICSIFFLKNKSKFRLK